MQQSSNTTYVYMEPPPPYSSVVPGANQGTSYPGPPPTIINVAPAPQQPRIVLMGAGCPVCRNGYIRSRPNCLGILCCIMFFPFVFTGLLFLCFCRETYCANCGAVL